MPQGSKHYATPMTYPAFWQMERYSSYLLQNGDSIRQRWNWGRTLRCGQMSLTNQRSLLLVPAGSRFKVTMASLGPDQKLAASLP
jgi:hypothetical protein